MEANMPQVSLYIDKETMDKIGQLARKGGVSISRWVGDNLKRLIRDEYPEEFWGVFGAVQDEYFTRPEELSPVSDSPRVSL
jgi:hypothetical protein